MGMPWEIDLTVYDDEAERLEGLRRHDHMACTCLLKRFAPRLYRLALQLTATLDEADDVLQEGFIQACKQLDRFKGHSGLGTWLHRIVLNAGLMRLRGGTPELVSLTAQTDSAQPMLQPALMDWESDPRLQVIGGELSEAIQQAILTLPDSLRAAVVLRDVEGLATGEAAAVLGIGESALKVRLHRGRLLLREAIAPYIDEHASDVQRA
jgi:RNA polymerase sigma-70 factor (ECF subfamily)